MIKKILWGMLGIDVLFTGLVFLLDEPVLGSIGTFFALVISGYLGVANKTKKK